MRLRLYDLRTSDFPFTNGLCATDTVAIANLANRCQRRLIFSREAGDEGWYGSWAEVAFNTLSRLSPYLTCPRQIARIQDFNVCNCNIATNNQFYEYLRFGDGRMPSQYRCDNLGLTSAYMRNDAVTFVDLPAPPQKIAVYTTDSTDVQAGYRVLIQGLDQNDSVIYSQDGSNEVKGEYVYLKTPFATSSYSFNRITGIQKDVTNGSLQFFAVDATTGTQTLIHTMEPSEQVAGYRRYYFDNLPASCCPPTLTTPVPVQVTAIAKLELIPVVADQDYLLIQNLEAMIEEAWSIHYSDLESATSKTEAVLHHKKAIGHLNAELTHYLGTNKPAISFKPFGSARLEKIRINMI